MENPMNMDGSHQILQLGDRQSSTIIIIYQHYSCKLPFTIVNIVFLYVYQRVS